MKTLESDLEPDLVPETLTSGVGEGARHPSPLDARGLSKRHTSASLRKRQASIELYRGAGFLRVRVQRDRRFHAPPKPRGEVTEFTDPARRRMLDFLAKINTSLIPIFVTLTYPDDFPSLRTEFKNHLDLLGQRVRRRWPESFIVWKLEFKQRKSGANAGKMAPHYHLFIFGVPMQFPFQREIGASYSLRVSLDEVDSTVVVWKQHVLGELVDLWQSRPGIVEPTDTLRGWMSRNWFEIVGSNDLKHFRAGTRVEELRSSKGTFAYAAKRSMGKPEACSGLGMKPGRFWGVIGRSKVKFGIKEVHHIPAAQAFTILRLIRRYRRANTPPARRKFLKFDQFSAKLYCPVDRWLETALRTLDGRAESQTSDDSKTQKT